MFYLFCYFKLWNIGILRITYLALYLFMIEVIMLLQLFIYISVLASVGSFIASVRASVWLIFASIWSFYQFLFSLWINLILQKIMKLTLLMLHLMFVGMFVLKIFCNLLAYIQFHVIFMQWFFYFLLDIFFIFIAWW